MNSTDKSKLESFLERFIDNGFLDFFPNAKADLLQQFVQSLGRLYHLDGKKSTEKPGTGVLLDFLKVIDLLMEKENKHYIPDFFIAIAQSPPTSVEPFHNVVSPEERLAATFAIIQLDELVNHRAVQESWSPTKHVSQSIFVIRNNLVVNYALPSLATQKEIRLLAENIKLTIKAFMGDPNDQAMKNDGKIKVYLDQNLSVNLGEAELHILASDQLRVKRRMSLY